MSRRTRARRMRISVNFFSRNAERSELLIESEARSNESLEARSAESRSDVAPNARRRAQADVNLGQVFLYIYLFILCVHGT